MTGTRNIVHVAPNGRVDELSFEGAVTYLARTRNPAHRRRFSTREAAVAHLRAMHLAHPPEGFLAIIEDSVREMEGVIEVERGHGTRPDDGTSAGRIMAKELQWVAYHRAQLANASREAHSWYDPKGGGDVRG